MIPVKEVIEGQPLTVPIRLTDGRPVAVGYFFRLPPSVPSGVTISPVSGIVQWTPSPIHGGRTFSIRIQLVAADWSRLVTETLLTVHVRETNKAPFLTAIPDQRIKRHQRLELALHASDTNKIVNRLTYALEGDIPAGMRIDAQTGRLTWQTDGATVPRAYDIAIRVTDDGTPPASTTGSVSIRVDELKLKPFFVGRRAGETWTGSPLEIEFCWCPSGSFAMGSSRTEPDRRSNEDRVRVTLTSGFWLGKYEVTQQQWEALIGDNPGWFTTTGSGKAAVAGRPTGRFPVEQVTWDEAMSFCQTLTARERAVGRLPAAWEFTLPTEAQWEYACRAGTTTATAFGARLSSVDANFKGDTPYNRAAPGPFLSRPTSVGQYRPNAWGLFDMHGNVAEWCRDSFGVLEGGRDPLVNDMQAFRVPRGGSWASEGSFQRSAYRYGYQAAGRVNYLGLRLAVARSR